jgi:uncharacterized protein involved in tellurium resistance
VIKRMPYTTNMCSVFSISNDIDNMAVIRTLPFLRGHTEPETTNITTA